jgi:hypothetical protein
MIENILKKAFAVAWIIGAMVILMLTTQLLITF